MSPSSATPAEDSPATLVARFLRSNHYTETLDAFLREANLPPDTGAASKNVITIEQVLSEKKTYDLSQSFEKVGVQDGSQSWKTPAPSKLHIVSGIPNPSNILHVSVDRVVEGDGGAEQRLLASAANKSLFALSTHEPYQVLSSEPLSHGSPILSWVLIRRQFLITSSMSGYTVLVDLHSKREIWSRRDHMKYVVTVSVREDSEGFWLVTAGWDARILLYRFAFRDLKAAAETGALNLSTAPSASVTLPTNPESLLFVDHPELTQPVLLLSRRDSTFLYYYAIPDNIADSNLDKDDPFDVESVPKLSLLGRQNLAPHSNAWIAFTPSAFALHPTDPSIIAVATSHVPHMKLIIVRLLLPPSNSLASDESTTAPPVFDATTGPIHNPTQASEARRLLAVQNHEDAAIQLQMSTLAPQTAYSTPALAWRPDASGVWVNGDDGVVRGVEAKTGKVVSVLKDGHEAGTKVRCLWAGMVNGEEWVVSGGFDKKLIVWRCG